jgi:hypothetical protein
MRKAVRSPSAIASLITWLRMSMSRKFPLLRFTGDAAEERIQKAWLIPACH